MFGIVCIKVTIGKLLFKYATEIDIFHTWNELTGTATITLPRKLKLQDQRVTDLVHADDEVKIEIGYNGKFKTEFEGYVVRLIPGIPVVIECEDEMRKLKRTNFTKSWKSVTLKEVVKYIAPAYADTAEMVDSDLGAFMIDGGSATNVLDFLKREYGLVSWFRGKKLFVGFRYSATYNTLKLHFQKNIVNGESLKFLRKEDVKIKVIGISKKPNNASIKAEVGEDGGDVRTLHFFNLSESQLKIQAEEEMKKIKVDGYDGSLTLFGIPYIEHGDVAEIINDEYTERNGKYFIDSVRVKVGSGGYRRIVEVGKIAA